MTFTDLQCDHCHTNDEPLFVVAAVSPTRDEEILCNDCRYSMDAITFEVEDLKGQVAS